MRHEFTTLGSHVTWARVWSAKGVARASQFSRAKVARAWSTSERYLYQPLPCWASCSQQVVVEVFDADADGDEAEGVGVVVVSGGFEDSKGVGGVHVGDAVGHEDDVVVGVWPLSPSLVGQPDGLIQSRLHVGGAGGLKADYGVPHSLLIRATVCDGVLMNHVLAEVDDGDAVLVSETGADAFRCLSCDVQAVAFVHRA